MVEKWFCNWGSDLQCIFSHNLFVSAKKRSNNGAAIKSYTQTRARSNSNNDKNCIQNVISLCGVRVATLNGALFFVLHKSIYRISTHELAKIETKWIGELRMPIETGRRAAESEREGSERVSNIKYAFRCQQFVCGSKWKYNCIVYYLFGFSLFDRVCIVNHFVCVCVVNNQMRLLSAFRLLNKAVL